MSAGKKTPLNDLLREATAAWQVRPEPRPGAPPGFATRVVALSRETPPWELTLWTRFSFGGLAVALMLGVFSTLNYQRMTSGAGEAQPNSVIELLEGAP